MPAPFLFDRCAELGVHGKDCPDRPLLAGPEINARRCTCRCHRRFLDPARYARKVRELLSGRKR